MLLSLKRNDGCGGRKNVERRHSLVPKREGEFANVEREWRVGGLWLQ